MCVNALSQPQRERERESHRVGLQRHTLISLRQKEHESLGSACVLLLRSRGCVCQRESRSPPDARRRVSPALVPSFTPATYGRVSCCSPLASLPDSLPACASASLEQVCRVRTRDAAKRVFLFPCRCTPRAVEQLYCLPCQHACVYHAPLAAGGEGTSSDRLKADG